MIRNLVATPRAAPYDLRIEGGRISPSVPPGFVPKPEDYAGSYAFLAQRQDNRAATGSILPLETGMAVGGISTPSIGARLAENYGAVDPE